MDKQEHKTLIDVAASVDEYLSQIDWRVNANANQGYSLGGLILNVSGKVIANYWLNHVYASEIGAAHRAGDLHIHDLDMLSGYCAGWSLRTLLTEGFNGVANKIEANPPKHLSSAVGQMVNFLGTLQNEWAGAQSYSSMDSYLAPLVRKDNLSYSEVKQCIQELIYNLNVPSRWGSQTPFTNLTFDWTCPEDLREQIPYIGGEEMPFSYGELQAEMDMINRAFIEVMTEGDAKGRIFSLHPKEKVVVFDQNNQSVIVDSIGKIIDAKLEKEGVLDVRNYGLKALSFNFKTLKTEFRKITRFIKHKEANTCVKVKTNTGNEFIVTKGHSLFTFTETGEILPAPIKNLKTGDFILSAKKFNRPILKKTLRLPLNNIKGSKYVFDNTIELSAELLWLFGFFAGNGNVLYKGDEYVKGIQLSSTKSEVLDQVEEKISCLPLIFNYKRNDNKDITIVSFTIGQLFYDFFNGNIKANTKCVPVEVFSSEHFEEFIKGYFTADGNQSTLKIRTVSQQMRETLPVLFSYKGYKCYVRKYDYNQYKGMADRKNPLYQLTFTRNDLKKNVFPLWKYIRDNLIKKNGWNVKDYGSYKRHNLSLGKIAELYSCLVARATKENKVLKDNFIEKIIDGDLFLEKITSIDELEYEGYVYDFSVEETEAFVGANSIIFHNTFPIPTYNITPDFPWDSPNTDLLFEMTARYGLPYFSNFVKSDMKPNMVRSMCCRLRLELTELLKRGNGLFGSAEMTGSLGVVTINCARLGYLYKGDETALYQRLDTLLKLGKDSLEVKRKVIQQQMDNGLFPFTKRYLGTLRNHFSTIGVNGINEMIRNFTNDKQDITTEWGQIFAIRLLDHIRTRMVEFQEETGHMYNLEATPAEGTTYRFAKEDKKRYPDIIQAGTPDRPYYTNSSQLPVGFTDDPFEALELQDELQTKYTGGTVNHLYMNERISSAQTCKTLVRRVLENYRLPYITITPTFSICPKHGYLAGEHEFCPLCDEEQITKKKESKIK
jgi:anaerobic ribonucleoside-triphosphate reductase